MRSIRWFILGTIVLLALAGCGQRRAAAPGGSAVQKEKTVSPKYADNGQQIYLTATSQSGDKITHTGGPSWLATRDGGCAVCHGPDGHGGTVPSSSEMAPDIRYSTLTTEHYTDTLIKRTITKGLDEAGQPLSPTMPHWSMSDRDLTDLIAYLKTL